MLETLRVLGWRWNFLFGTIGGTKKSKIEGLEYNVRGYQRHQKNT
jgi:hypothetical protein